MDWELLYDWCEERIEEIENGMDDDVRNNQCCLQVEVRTFKEVMNKIMDLYGHNSE
jgi:hypothetical protein